MLLSIFISGILIYVIAPLPQVAVLMSFAPHSGREKQGRDHTQLRTIPVFLWPSLVKAESDFPDC